MTRSGPVLVAALRQALAAGAVRETTAGGGAWLGIWALSAALAGLGLWLWDGYHAGFLALNALAASLSSWFWMSATLLGDERVALALTLFFCRRRPHWFWTLLVAGLIAAISAQGLKHLVAAARPPAVLEPGSFQLIGPAHRRNGFPSGHTVTAAVFCGVWVFFLRHAALRLSWIALALLAGGSRVALGVHWPVDVAAGMSGGVLAAWLGAWLAPRMPWGLDHRVHLTGVGLAAGAALALVLHDGGYPQTAGLQLALGLGALGMAWREYVWRPLRGTEPAAGPPEDA